MWAASLISICFSRIKLVRQHTSLFWNRYCICASWRRLSFNSVHWMKIYMKVWTTYSTITLTERNILAISHTVFNFYRDDIVNGENTSGSFCNMIISFQIASSDIEMPPLHDRRYYQSSRTAAKTWLYYEGVTSFPPSFFPLHNFSLTQTCWCSLGQRFSNFLQPETPLNVK